MDAPFAPGGPSYLVVNSAVQIPVGAGQSFRIVSLAAAGTIQYIGWGPTNSVTATAPTAGNPQPNTLAIPGGSERTIRVPVTFQGPLYWIASSSTGFIVMQGDGV